MEVGRVGTLCGCKTMKQIGYLFRPEMIRAILDDRKWVTRRLRGLEKINEWPGDNWRYDGLNINGDHLFFDVAGCISGHDPQECVVVVKCPWGNPGDVMWAKETWQYCRGCGRVNFKADHHDAGCICYEPLGQWRSPIYLQKADARIRRPIVSIRPERLNDMTEDDARAEGCEPVVHSDGCVDCGTRKTTFAALWDSINPDFPWKKNPWVWRSEFARKR